MVPNFYGLVKSIFPKNFSNPHDESKAVSVLLRCQFAEETVANLISFWLVRPREGVGSGRS
jgi:hypothetical protein